INLRESFAYSNGDEDVPFLSTVGLPRAVNPGKALLAHAQEAGWPVFRFADRGRPSVTRIARTAAAYGAMATAMGAGLSLGLINRNQRVGLDTVSALIGDLALPLAGVSLNVQGEEHLWSHRPAVFLFNHQSQLDMPILCKLLRNGFTAVAKKQLANDPFFGLAFRAAGVAFVDRSGKADPRKALEPAVERLREGVSVVVAPEGTRSLTPALDAFKKGGFHLAMQADVPIIPIVIRNAGELMWRDSATIGPGEVDVAVLPPIDVSDWTTEDLDERIAEVRGLYLKTLADWPSPHASTQAL
ncbi:MAG: 1-acylglycerol-3-phosphate O-acyltransferase, partial [Aeromicrobium sp.]